jgi:polyhydroxyalkanoate synthesis regulator phasin
MDEKKEIIQQLKAELQWIKYRIRMLDIIEEKLMQMRKMAEIVKEANLSSKEIEAINIEIHSLEEQVKALDSESRNSEDDKIL